MKLVDFLSEIVKNKCRISKRRSQGDNLTKTINESLNIFGKSLLIPSVSI